MILLLAWTKKRTGLLVSLKNLSEMGYSTPRDSLIESIPDYIEVSTSEAGRYYGSMLRNKHEETESIPKKTHFSKSGFSESSSLSKSSIPETPAFSFHPAITRLAFRFSSFMCSSWYCILQMSTNTHHEAWYIMTIPHNVGTVQPIHQTGSPSRCNACL